LRNLSKSKSTLNDVLKITTFLNGKLILFFHNLLVINSLGSKSLLDTTNGKFTCSYYINKLYVDTSYSFINTTIMANVDENINKVEKDAQFEKEFMPLINSLYNFAYRLTLDEDDANDLVQETFLKAYRFFNSYEQGTNAKAWLFRILKNSFINDFRKKSKEPSKVDYQEVESFYNSDDIDENITTDLRVESLQDMIGDEVANALNSLAVDFRTIIILCDLEGFTYEEMAKILDIPIGTVRSRLHRARNLLKDKLREYAGTMGFKE
jgi:RNA polymerase sigma-70 factor (ECF subfamily)